MFFKDHYNHKQNMNVYKFLIIVCCLLGTLNVFSQKEIQVGILMDMVEDEVVEPFLTTLKEEIQRTIGADYLLKIEQSNVLNAIKTPLQSEQRYTQLQNRNLDFIIVLGPKSLSGVAKQSIFKTPTIGVGVLDGQLQGLSKNVVGSTGIENFTYVQSSTALYESIKKFKQLSDFKSLPVLIDTELIGLFNQKVAEANVLKIEQELGIKIRPIRISNESSEQLTLPDSTKAVFLLLGFEFPKEDLSQIVTQLNEQKIASFSSVQEHVNSGILFSYGDDRGQMLRKIALTIDESLEGFSLAEMPVDIDLNQQLYVNISTAQTIQFPLTYETVFTANVVEKNKALPIYGLIELLEKGLSENLTVKISQQEVLNSKLDIEQARSNYYPDLDFSATYSEISKNQTNDIFGQSQRSVTGNLSLNQVIFSESILANIRISEYLLKAQEYNTQQDILDVLFDTYSAYFSILQNQASLEIQQENLEVSKKNLELAKLKNSLGAADNSDVYRFEGELANNIQNVIDAQANVILAKLSLNQLLNYTLPEEYEVVESGLESDIFQNYNNHTITKLIQSPLLMKKLIDFLVLETQNQNPSKGALIANEKLLERQLQLNERLFYTPTISASGSLNSTFLRGGLASKAAAGVEPMDHTWNLGVTVSYPILDGNRRRLDKQQTHVSLEQMRLNLENFDQNIRLAIQNRLLSLFTAYTELDYSKKALDNQTKNFELNQNKYRVGQVSIVQFLDAQNALVQAKQTYALSIYNFIQMFLQLEYNVGYFTQLENPAKLQDFEIRLQQFLK